MSRGAGIAWTDATWNPVRGCSPLSPGCAKCYAMAMAARFSGIHPKTGKPMAYHGLARMTEYGPRWTGEVRVAWDKLREPLGWRKPLKIFVNSMSDLFHEKLAFHEIDDVFDVMIQADWHTYQILTKRADRMLEYFSSCGNRTEYLEKHPGIWVGVSVEDEARLSRLRALAQIPARVRWISAEPLLSPLDLSPWLDTLSWVVVGGESGPDARPMELEWALSIQAQCAQAGVAFFMKQAGAVLARRLGWRDKKGADLSEFPPALQVQNFPSASAIV